MCNAIEQLQTDLLATRSIITPGLIMRLENREAFPTVISVHVKHTDNDPRRKGVAGFIHILILLLLGIESVDFIRNSIKS